MIVFILGLFTAVGRWLRISRVRPLTLRIQPTDAIPVFAGALFAEWAWIILRMTQYFHQCGIFFGASRCSIVISRIIRAESDSFIETIHTIHSHPARARRQPPSVPGSFSEAPTYRHGYAI